MSNFTRKAIQDSFTKLLERKPLKQITVMDIVNDCGISRNTFYYHFHDIPELVECIIKENADNIIKANPEINSISDCVNAVIDSSLKSKRAVLHIYKSLNRNIFEQYHWKICEYAVEAYLKSNIKNIEISPEDKAAILAYMKSVCFGIVMLWLDTNLDDKMQSYIHRICELKQGDLNELIEKCKLN